MSGATSRSACAPPTPSLRQIDPTLEESARILGASWGHTLKEITLPLMRPGLFAGWLLVFVPVIQELSASILLFSSSSMTLAVAIYNLYETGYTEPVAALAMVNMAIITRRDRARPQDRWRRHRSQGRRNSPARRNRLMAGITIASLSKSYGGRHLQMAALQDLNLKIEDNQFITLLGPSGCGKTTTLRLIAGYVTPDTGSIHVDDRLRLLAGRRGLARGARHGHGLPELRGLAAQDGLREHRLRPEAAEALLGAGCATRSRRRSSWST